MYQMKLQYISLNLYQLDVISPHLEKIEILLFYVELGFSKAQGQISVYYFVVLCFLALI